MSDLIREVAMDLDQGLPYWFIQMQLYVYCPWMTPQEVDHIISEAEKVNFDSTAPESVDTSMLEALGGV
jgi:hypothetical protein